MRENSCRQKSARKYSWGVATAVVALAVGFDAPHRAAATDDLVAWWSFDEVDGRMVVDRASGMRDAIEGRVTPVRGAVGGALRLDGFTSSIRRRAADVPAITGPFTAEAWVALAAYPWNWAPLIAHDAGERAGFYFGIAPEGHVGLQVALDGRWEVCRSDAPVALRRWTHVAATYEVGAITVYIDGRPAARCDAKGTFTPATNLDLLIGRNRTKRMPSHPVRPQATLEAWYSLDGIIDEIKLHRRALAPDDLRRIASAVVPPPRPEIPARVMPSGPPGPGRFGAYYTKLEYYPEWDALWRVGDFADVVVQFDGSPIRVVFWRGTRYSPVWVMENGIWMADQSAEHFTNEDGCFEHMLDPQTRFSHVRILENHDARVVVHWRYAPISVRGDFSQVDERTGWGDWVDEYYTFLPDGVGVREVVMWTSGKPLGPSEIIVLAHPGQRPEDVINLDALTLVNLKGEAHTYSWAEDAPDFTKDLRPADPVIQVVNLKSQHKPFEIFEPGARMRVFRHEMRRDVAPFPWWNHWPEAQIPSDGRYAIAPDRPSHFSLAWGGPPIHQRAEHVYYATWLYGTTLGPPSELAVLARSWAAAPLLEVTSAGFESLGYVRTQRAYRLRRTAADATTAAFDIRASSTSPLRGASIVIENWGDRTPAIQVNGRVVSRAEGARVGLVRRLERTDLVAWIEHSATTPVQVTISGASFGATAQGRSR